MELQVGVKILLKNKDGKYLLVRRNPKKYPEVGPKWDIVGGRIIPGTPLLDNLRREIKEEVNLDYAGEPQLVSAGYFKNSRPPCSPADFYWFPGWRAKN